MTQSDQTVCRWCGEPARHKREVVPEQLHPRTKQVVKKGIYTDVCDEHNAMFDREEQRRELQKSIRRLETRRLKRRPYDPQVLAERRRQLEAL